MALTTFVDGVTVVTAAWLNAVFGTSTGHVHDGSDNDGHASQINDETHIDFDNADRLCRVYTDLDTAIGDLTAGETCIVDETDPTKAFLGSLWTDAFTAGAARGYRVATDGEYVYWGDYGGDLRIIDRSGAEIHKVTVGVATPISAVACDGRSVVVACGTNVKMYKRSVLLAATSTVKWTYAHGANVLALAIDGNAVFFGGVVNGSTITHGQLNYSTGAVDYSDDHNGTVYGIATDGEYVWVTGNRDAATDIILRCQPYDLSSTIIAETDADADGIAVALSHDYVVLVKDYHASSDYTVKCFSKMRFSAFELVWETFRVSWSPQNVCCDDRYAYVVGDRMASVGSVLVFSLATGALVGHYDTGLSNDSWGITTDGFALYVAHDDLGSGEGLSALYLGRLPSSCYRAAATDRYRRPYHQLMLPGR